MNSRKKDKIIVVSAIFGSVLVIINMLLPVSLKESIVWLTIGAGMVAPIIATSIIKASTSIIDYSLSFYLKVRYKRSKVFGYSLNINDVTFKAECLQNEINEKLISNKDDIFVSKLKFKNNDINILNLKLNDSVLDLYEDKKSKIYTKASINTRAIYERNKIYFKIMSLFSLDELKTWKSILVIAGNKNVIYEFIEKKLGSWLTFSTIIPLLFSVNKHVKNFEFVIAIWTYVISFSISVILTLLSIQQYENKQKKFLNYNIYIINTVIEDKKYNM